MSRDRLYVMHDDLCICYSKGSLYRSTSCNGLLPLLGELHIATYMLMLHYMQNCGYICTYVTFDVATYVPMLRLMGYICTYVTFDVLFFIA